MSSNEMTHENNDAKFRKMSDEELLAEVRRCMMVCAQDYVNLANVACVALRRGLNLSFVNPKLLDVLRKIDCKQILPELAERFMHCGIFWRLKNLPIDDQRRIAETGVVEIVVRGDGKFVTKKLNVDAITANQAGLVFDNGRIRSKQEMTNILQDMLQPEPEGEGTEEETVSFKFPSVSIDVSKAKARSLKEKAELAGGMDELIRHAIKKMLA